MKDISSAIIMQVEGVSIEAQESMLMAELKNAAKRQAERLAAYKAWVEPEAIAARIKEHEEQAAAALEKAEKLKEMMGVLPDPPLPDPIPKHMQGQSPSTIRAMLRQESWKFDETLGKWIAKTPDEIAAAREGGGLST